MADARGASTTVVPLDGSNYNTWKIQCRMALMKENLWSIVSGTEVAPAATEAEKLAKFEARRDKAGDNCSFCGYVVVVLVRRPRGPRDCVETTNGTIPKENLG